MSIERDEAQHLQQLFAADERREARQDIRVAGIAPERDPGHLAMMADQEPERFRGRRLQLEAIDGRLREAQALARVAVVAARADIVQQQRERQELGRAQLLQQACESRAGGSVRVAEHLETADRQDRVRRRGVAPDGIRRRTPVDLLQLGKQPIEQPALGHLQQPGRNAGTRAEQVEHSAAIVGIATKSSAAKRSRCS